MSRRESPTPHSAAIYAAAGRGARRAAGNRRPARSAGLRPGRLVIGLAVVSTAGFGAWSAGLAAPAWITVVVFVTTLLLWVGTRLDETLVALGAAVVLVIAGVLDDNVFFGTLADSTIWLLIAAFVLAAGVSGSGLTTRFAARMVARARSVRQLAHLVTAALVATAIAVPATSGRAALAVPVFVALARVLADRPRVVRALAVLFPTVILLSAVATLIGAGAHLVTNQILAASTGQSVSFGQWLLLGIPLAVASAHTAAELVLALFTHPADRRAPLRVPVAVIAAQVTTPVTGRLPAAQCRAALILAAVVLAWCTGSLHGLDPALVALAGALVLSAPRVGVVPIGDALKGVPWSLLLFMAATAALAAALIASGAAGWLADALFGPIGSGPSWLFLVVVVLLSVAAHLVVQSRTARSSVLVPLVVPAAIALGLNPVAVAFASTAAAGFCHTLTSSAKPVAMFARIDDVATYDARDLLRLSVWLAPLTAALVLGCALFVWPYLGLPLR